MARRHRWRPRYRGAVDGAPAAEEARREALTRVQRDQHHFFRDRPAVCGGGRQCLRAGIHRHRSRTEGRACQAICGVVRRQDEATARQPRKDAAGALRLPARKGHCCHRRAHRLRNRAPQRDLQPAHPDPGPAFGYVVAAAAGWCRQREHAGGTAEPAHLRPQGRSRPYRSEIAGRAIAARHEPPGISQGAVRNWIATRTDHA